MRAEHVKMKAGVVHAREDIRYEEIEKPTFTENGKKIIVWMREHPEMPMVKAREVAEGLVISSRAVSGAFRKLVSDGFVEKVGQDPVIYVLTDKGKNFEIVD